MSTTISTHTVGDGSESVTYDVRGDLATATSDRPVLLMFASPMEAASFGTLASFFNDRPVVTYDPRGAGRNPTETAAITPQQHAQDLHRVIEAIGGGPVDVFASSGGAVNALALVEAYPDDVRWVVAHEPPTVALLPDKNSALAAIEDIRATYATSGSGPAMAKFIALVMHHGPVPDDWTDRPAPDPTTFGMSADDDGIRTDPLIRNMPACNLYVPDVEALAALGDRLIVAVGQESSDELAARGGRSVAAGVGIPVTDFPSHHAGFIGPESGQPGDPAAFAARLREVLDSVPSS